MAKYEFTVISNGDSPGLAWYNLMTKVHRALEHDDVCPTYHQARVLVNDEYIAAVERIIENIENEVPIDRIKMGVSIFRKQFPKRREK